MTAFFFTILIAYFLGSIPFGFILVRAVRGEDVRNTGSGNIGATNVGRSSLSLGILTLILDALKGLAAVYLVKHLFADRPALAAMAAFFAILGHMFPLWLRFRGGKGVATGLGAFFLLAPKSVLVAVAVFIALVVLFRYVSLASIVAVLLFPVLAWRIDGSRGAIVGAMTFSALLITLRHHANIGRLCAGNEARLASPPK